MVFIYGIINVCTAFKIKDYLQGNVKVTYNQCTLPYFPLKRYNSIQIPDYSADYLGLKKAP